MRLFSCLRLRTALGLACAAATLAPAPSLGAEIVIKAANTIATTNARHVPWAKFKELVEAKSQGRMEVQLFPNAALGNDNELLEKVQMGAIQIAFASSSNLTTSVKDWEVFDLPYLFMDTDANQKLFYVDGRLGGPVFERLDAQMLKKNIRILWISPAAFRAVGVNGPGLKLPADLKGKKIRCTASRIEREAIAAFGANPVAMGMGEIYTALQQKTLDGEALPPDLMFDSKHSEVIRSVVVNKFNGFFTLANMNAAFYDGLPAWAKTIVDESAAEAIAHTNACWDDMLNDRVDKMRAAGVEVYEPTAEEWALWQGAVQPLVDEYLHENGRDWYDTVKAALAR